MNPQAVWCPNVACPARGQRGQGNSGGHSQHERRDHCRVCDKTFGARTGTIFPRRRTAAALSVISLLSPWSVGAVRSLPANMPLASSPTPSAPGSKLRASMPKRSTTRRSPNRATWATCRPMQCASRRSAASSGWPWR